MLNWTWWRRADRKDALRLREKVEHFRKSGSDLPDFFSTLFNFGMSSFIDRLDKDVDSDSPLVEGEIAECTKSGKDDLLDSDLTSPCIERGSLSTSFIRVMTVGCWHFRSSCLEAELHKG